MPSLNSIFEQLDTTLIDTFGVIATLYPQAGGEVSIKGIFAPPAMLEEVMPGLGASVVRFFVRLSSIAPLPQSGDTVQINDDLFDIFDTEADNAGSGVLKLRKKA